MTLYTDILPSELRELIELYICPVKICVLIDKYDEPSMTLETVSDAIKDIADIIILYTMGFGRFRRDNVHIYQALNKKHEFLATDINVSQLCRYSDVTKIIDSKNKYIWYDLPLMSTQNIKVSNINLFKQELCKTHYNTFRIKSEKILGDFAYLDKIQTNSTHLSSVYCLDNIVLV